VPCPRAHLHVAPVPHQALSRPHGELASFRFAISMPQDAEDGCTAEPDVLDV